MKLNEGFPNQYPVSVVIPNWNGMHCLPACLSSLKKQSLRDFEIIVVDNGSSDNSVHFITNEYPSVKLIKLPVNSGFAAACNLGIRNAYGKYVAVLNNDTEVMPEWLESLISAASRDEKIGMVASKILLDLETREIDSAGMLIYPDGIGKQRGRWEIDNGQFDQEQEVLFPSACAALYDMGMLHEIGLFDEEFFAYCEDTDIGLRGRLAGWKAVFAPKAVVYHKYSVTSGRYSSFKAFQIERNRIWVGIKNFPLTWVLMMPYNTMKRYFFQLFGIFLSKGSASRFKQSHSSIDIIATIIKSYISALKGLPLMLRKRKTVRRTMTSREFSKILKQYRIGTSKLTLSD
jgi:GT2 family glycosyltransferase